MPITDRHAEYEAFAPQWSRVRDAVAGGDAIKAKDTAYLPQPDGMDLKAYAAYKFRARWYDVTERTKRGLVGVIFRKEPIIEAPARLRAGLDSLAASAKSFPVFVRQLTGEIVTVGRHGILVDLPGEQPAGTLPVWAGYSTEAIRDWQQTRIDGRLITSKVVLSEPDETESDASEQFRELVLVEGLYEVRIWRKLGDKDEFRIVETISPTRAGKRLESIPFVFVGVDDLDPDVEKPPLLGLADENIGHYQLSADLRHSLFLTALPTPWAIGFGEDEQPSHLGSGALWTSSNPEASVGMLEFQGAGIGAIRQEMQDAENRMVLLGARFFERNKMAAEAARAIELRLGADGATLTTIAQTVGAALTRALGITAWWAGMSPEPETDQASVEMNTDFLPTDMPPQQIQALIQLWQSGGIAFSDLIAKLKEGEIVAEDRTAEQIQAETETQPVAIPNAGLAPGEEIIA